MERWVLGETSQVELNDLVIITVELELYGLQAVTLHIETSIKSMYRTAQPCHDLSTCSQFVHVIIAAAAANLLPTTSAALCLVI